MSQKININRMGVSGLYCVGVVVPTGERPDEAAVDREVCAKGLRYLSDRWDEQEMEEREGFTLFTKPAEPAAERGPSKDHGDEGLNDLQRRIDALAERNASVFPVYLADDGRTGAKKATARLDAAFAEKVDRYRESVTSGGALEIVGFTTTTLRSVVLRVGRQAERKPVCARITIRGDAYDIQVKGDPAPFFAAAQDGGLHRVTARIAWKRDAGGQRRVDAEKSCVIALAKLPPALRGAALLDALSDAMPTLVSMSDEEIQVRLAESRGGR